MTDRGRIGEPLPPCRGPPGSSAHRGCRPGLMVIPEAHLPPRADAFCRPFSQSECDPSSGAASLDRVRARLSGLLRRSRAQSLTAWPLIRPRSTRRWPTIRMVLGVCAACLAPLAADAGGVVGTGTAASCTEAALNAALVGGGAITFNCGPGPAAIVVGAPKIPTGTTTVVGGGLITLSGGNGFQVFRVNPGVALTLRNLTLTLGHGVDGGCLYNGGGTLNVINVVVERCVADHDGGGIFNAAGGQTSIAGSTISNNTAGFDCGGVCDFGVLTVSTSTVSGNM